MADLIDINSRKKTKLREKASHKAKKWDKFMKWIDSGLVTITIAGTVLHKEEMKAFEETLEAEIKEDDKRRTKLKVQKHRKQPAKKID